MAPNPSLSTARELSLSETKSESTPLLALEVRNLSLETQLSLLWGSLGDTSQVRGVMNYLPTQSHRVLLVSLHGLHQICQRAHRGPDGLLISGSRKGVSISGIDTVCSDALAISLTEWEGDSPAGVAGNSWIELSPGSAKACAWCLSGCCLKEAFG